MFQLFINENSLDKICREQMCKPEQEWSDWFKILSQLKEIYIGYDTDKEYWEDDDPIYIFSKIHNVEIKDASDEISEIYSDPSKVLQYSSPVFILNIPDESAKDIQNKYGVICVTANDMDGSPLAIDSDTAQLIEGQKDPDYENWSDVLSMYRSLPSNGVIIIDRYLFNKETETSLSGLNNLYDILNSLLPEKFSGIYNISIIIDHEALKNEMPFNKLGTKINKLKKRLRTYEINMEVVGINSAQNGELYDITHDRRIITNYTYTFVPHALRAFVADKCDITQSISLSSLFSGIHKKRKGFPVRIFDRLLEDLNKIKKYWIGQKSKGLNTTYQLAVNGNYNVSPDNWNNRLLNI